MMDFQLQTDTTAEQTATQVYEKLHDASVTTDVTSEYALPDYLPPAEKLLRVSAIPTISGKYMNGEKVDFDGIVKWELLYLSDEGKLCAFTAQDTFHESCPVHNLDENCIVFATVSADGVTCRLSGPRKLSLRCQCETKICAVTKRTVSPELADTAGAVPEDDVRETIETETVPMECCRFFCAEEDGIRCSEDIAAEHEIGEIISVEHRVIPASAKISGGKLDYRCDVFFDVLYRAGDERCYSVQKHFPIARQLDVPEMPDGAACYGECELRELTVQSGADRMGEQKQIELDYVLCVSFTAYQNEKAPIVRDTFSTMYPSETETQNCRVLRHRKTEMVNFTVSGMLPMNGETATRVVDIRGEAGELTVKSDKNRFTVSGDVLLTMLFEDENGRIFSAEGEVPFQYETASDGFMGDVDRRASCVICDLVGRTDGSQVRTDMEVRLCFSVLEKVNLSYVSTVTLDTGHPDIEDDTAKLVMYYPKRGESIWEIAKRYRVSPNSVRAANGMDAECEKIGDERVISVSGI